MRREVTCAYEGSGAALGSPTATSSTATPPATVPSTVRRVFVSGVWHLGAVTAAACARHVETIAHDPDPAVTAALRSGNVPVEEPGLAELIADGLRSGRLRVVDDPSEAAGCDVVWVTHDTPVDAAGVADAEWLGRRLEDLFEHLGGDALVVVSSQVPLGFTRNLASALRAHRPQARFRVACVPENLQLGRAVEGFTRPFAPAGTENGGVDPLLAALLAPFVEEVAWMTVESAELSKHAINAFLATSVALVNELARVGERTGADGSDVERVLRAEPRVGTKAYVRAGEPFDGTTLQRDVATVVSLGAAQGVATPLLAGVLESNERHRRWVRDTLERLLGTLEGRLVVVLGLAAKVDTNSLRGSAGADLCAWLTTRGAQVRAVDPAVVALPEGLTGEVELLADPYVALEEADAAVLTTPWPAFRVLEEERLAATMRHPIVIDPGGFLDSRLGQGAALQYVRVGRRPV